MDQHGAAYIDVPGGWWGLLVVLLVPFGWLFPVIRLLARLDVSSKPRSVDPRPF